MKDPPARSESGVDRLDPEFDLRSDAVTLPTDAMWDAMRAARPGWASVGEDESVTELEAATAALAGKEAALFVPTGTMGNLLALMSHTQRGDQIVVESSSHVLWSEEWSLAYVCGLVPRAVDGSHGALDPEAIDAAIAESRFGHRPRTSLVCLENTHTACGGAVIGFDEVTAASDAAHRHGVPVHLDGARIFNACAALEVEPRVIAEEVDSLVVNLNKGLSAPYGAVLCGSGSFIDRSRVNLRRLGAASFHQAGIAAAAGLVALRTMRARLAEDHVRARSLATGLARVRGITIDLAAVQTNIVMCRVDPEVAEAARLVAHLRGKAIGSYCYNRETIRFVTHRHVTDAAVEWIVNAVNDTLTSSSDLPKGPPGDLH